MNRQRTYFCIDMKSFYASVECAERGLDPFETNLVVADRSRGENALCLAITPKMKAMGIRNRCRLSEIPRGTEYITALPRMKFYIDYAADIYSLYLKYFSPQDIHVYSIDESFIDATDYLSLYGTDARSLAKKLMNEISETLHIPSTAGIGTNLFLAKAALDITAKRTKEHIGVLTEESFRETLWDHEPITDFWQISDGTARRLANYGIKTMRGITAAPERSLYGMFGINAELLIDHAWGRESCTMKDIKEYNTKSKSVSFSQILPRNYSFDEAKTVMKEMIMNGTQELMKRKVIAGRINIGIGYPGEFHEGTHGSAKLPRATAVNSVILPCAEELFDSVAETGIPIRRLGLTFTDLFNEYYEMYDMFTDINAVEKEKEREKAVLELTEKYGKGTVLKGTNLIECGTQRERNGMIGGHRAGYDDAKKQG